MSENKLESEERNKLGAGASNLSGFVFVVVVIVVFLRLGVNFFISQTQTPHFWIVTFYKRLDRLARDTKYALTKIIKAKIERKRALSRPIGISVDIFFI